MARKPAAKKIALDPPAGAEAPVGPTYGGPPHGSVEGHRALLSDMASLNAVSVLAPLVDDAFRHTQLCSYGTVRHTAGAHQTSAGALVFTRGCPGFP